MNIISSVQFRSITQSCPTLGDPMDCSTPGFLVHYQLPELTQTHVHRVGDAIQPSILCYPLLLLPSIFPSIRVFSNESVLFIRWPNIGVSASGSVRLLYLGWPFCILAACGSSLLWRFLTVGGVVWVACQGFLLREACVPVLVGLAGLLSGVQWSVL